MERRPLSISDFFYKEIKRLGGTFYRKLVLHDSAAELRGVNLADIVLDMENVKDVVFTLKQGNVRSGNVHFYNGSFYILLGQLRTSRGYRLVGMSVDVRGNILDLDEDHFDDSKPDFYARRIGYLI